MSNRQVLFLKNLIEKIPTHDVFLCNEFAETRRHELYSLTLLKIAKLHANNSQNKVTSVFLKFLNLWQSKKTFISTRRMRLINEHLNGLTQSSLNMSSMYVFQ